MSLNFLVILLEKKWYNMKMLLIPRITRAGSAEGALFLQPNDEIMTAKLPRMLI